MGWVRVRCASVADVRCVVSLSFSLGFGVQVELIRVRCARVAGVSVISVLVLFLH